MTDKEVGELWRSVVLGRGQRTSYSVHHSTKNVAETLIRKLVEERANAHCSDRPRCYRENAHKLEALRDFGIPPEDWK